MDDNSDNGEWLSIDIEGIHAGQARGFDALRVVLSGTGLCICGPAHGGYGFPWPSQPRASNERLETIELSR